MAEFVQTAPALGNTAGKEAVDRWPKPWHKTAVGRSRSCRHCAWT